MEPGKTRRLRRLCRIAADHRFNEVRAVEPGKTASNIFVVHTIVLALQ